MPTHARVVAGLCVGSGLCQSMNPEVFTLDDDGVANARRDHHDTERLRAVAECCPAGAIELVETGTDDGEVDM